MTRSPAMPRLMPVTGPQRVLALSNLVFTVGSGRYLTAGVLYFTEAVGLPAGQLGLGLAVAGLVSLALAVAVGHLAARRGARGVYAATLVAQSPATAAFLWTADFWPFVLLVSVASAAKADGAAAGWAVQVGTVTSYRLLVVGLSVSCAAAPLVLLALPPVAPAAVADGPRRAALRDRPYLLLTALDGVMAVRFKVLTVAVPLWLIGATAARAGSSRAPCSPAR
ncbi:hypothetical protein ACFZDK_35870 [Streptomyces sp. NPDC007901]|uniref:hypothetical protein n=1 Tax=Streptomyces sp. NPDC007901 TaxID=3364785 RepID=UPI0036ED0CAD